MKTANAKNAIVIARIANVRTAIAEKTANVVRIVSAGVAIRIMARPKLPRRTACVPGCKCFKPQGLDKNGHETRLFRDEFEAIKLHDFDGLDQKKSAKKMNISQPTFARILSSARQKITGAIVKGEEIHLDK